MFYVFILNLVDMRWTLCVLSIETFKFNNARPWLTKPYLVVIVLVIKMTNKHLALFLKTFESSNQKYTRNYTNKS